MVCTHRVVHYIRKEMQPLNTVEKPTFQEMLSFDRLYQFPGRTYMSQTAIPVVYSYYSIYCHYISENDLKIILTVLLFISNNL